jgi:hypothetical protein
MHNKIGKCHKTVVSLVVPIFTKGIFAMGVAVGVTVGGFQKKNEIQTH